MFFEWTGGQDSERMYVLYLRVHTYSVRVYVIT